MNIILKEPIMLYLIFQKYKVLTETNNYITIKLKNK
jgi:hypothetical protein